ncbi:Uncharacterised protein [Vibrio cholerae]|nr:Uncharacterised protein [Vibrio cholerae]CSI43006.1 Uncharacterised protein [Vibrio cholerae]
MAWLPPTPSTVCLMLSNKAESLLLLVLLDATAKL